MRATVILQTKYKGHLYQSGELINDPIATVFAFKGWATEDKDYTSLLLPRRRKCNARRLDVVITIHWRNISGVMFFALLLLGWVSVWSQV